MKFRGVLVAALVAITLVPTGAAQASPPSEPAKASPTEPAAETTNKPATAVERAMQRDLGLTLTEVRDLLADEATARQVASRIRNELGSRQAGIWFEDGKAAVGVTTNNDASRVRALGGVPHIVESSQAELAGTLKQVSALAGPDGVPGLTGWGIDPEHNQVVVTIDTRQRTKATDNFLARVRTLPKVVRIKTVQWSPKQQSDVVGGEAWKPGSEGNCSIGFSGTQTDGSRHFVTAGHCTNDANQAAYGKDGTRVGTSNVGGTGSVNAREGDFGLVDVTEAAWILTAKVSGYGNGDVEVTDSTEPVVGMSTCHSGVGTQWKCGKVTAVDQSIDYGSVIIDGLSITDACSASGDSGGAYVTGTSAVGLHSGGGNGCGTSDPTTIFQPVNEALRKWGLTLVTGGGQPGDVKVGNPGNQTTVVGQPASLTLSATGGTAPYTWSATGLPAGLTLDASSGKIGGTPTVEGNSSVTVTAKDDAGKTGSASFGWTISPVGGGDVVVQNPGRQDAYVGRPVSLPVRASGGSGALSYTATGLPTGLSINRSTGLISGTPTRWGIFNSRVTATDSANKSGNVSFTWNVWSLF